MRKGDRKAAKRETRRWGGEDGDMRGKGTHDGGRWMTEQDAKTIISEQWQRKRGGGGIKRRAATVG